jgi:hypothetical protein
MKEKRLLQKKKMLTKIKGKGIRIVCWPLASFSKVHLGQNEMLLNSRKGNLHICPAIGVPMAFGEAQFPMNHSQFDAIVVRNTFDCVYLKLKKLKEFTNQNFTITIANQNYNYKPELQL